MMERFWKPSITVLIAIIVAVPIIVVSLILVSLSWASSVRISENLGEEVMASAAQSVASEVREYLGGAVRVSDRYLRRLESGILPDPPGLAWERPMLDDLLTTPTIASICYGNAAGDTSWLIRGRKYLEAGRIRPGSENNATEFALDPVTGQAMGPPLRTYSYDPHSRPWWTAAVKSAAPIWSPVYLWYAQDAVDAMFSTGYTRAVRRPDGSLRGVISVDVTLGAVSDYLHRLDAASIGRVFIADNLHRLIATSQGRVTDDAGACFALDSAPDPAVRAVAASLGNQGWPTGRRTMKVNMDQAPARANVTKLRPYPGIDWHVVVVLPESAFLADAQAVRRRAVGAGAAIVAASLLLGLFLSRRLSRPLLSMTDHVKRVGQGDFDARLNLSGAKELAILSEEINRMAGGLKQRMVLEQAMSVAMEVQQSLLPAENPKCPLLDVSGRSHYCDETGGDYFDFIDVTAISESSLLLAVGDVTGHGIAAALLMASARGALRSVAIENRSLGDLLTHTNRVLAADNRHFRFMTLLLLQIDGESRSVRWASAGHDPPIVFDPATGEFRELPGGDVPLGIMEGVQYEQYQEGPLPEHSIVAVGTDGVWEMFEPGGAQYGKDRLREVIRANHTKTAAEIAAALDADLAAYRGPRAPADDVTFIIVKLLANS